MGAPLCQPLKFSQFFLSKREMMLLKKYGKIWMPKKYEAYKFDQPIRKSNSFQCSWELSRVEFHRFKCLVREGPRPIRLSKWKFSVFLDTIAFQTRTQALPNKLASLIFCIGNRTGWVRTSMNCFVSAFYLSQKKMRMSNKDCNGYWADIVMSTCECFWNVAAYVCNMFGQKPNMFATKREHLGGLRAT